MCYELLRCQIVLAPSPEITSGLVFRLHPITQCKSPADRHPPHACSAPSGRGGRGRFWHVTSPHAHPAEVSRSKYPNLWMATAICLNFMAPSPCHGHPSSLQNRLGFAYMRSGLLVELCPHADKPSAVPMITSSGTPVYMHLHKNQYFPGIVVQL